MKCKSYEAMLKVAYDEAILSLEEGGIPIGAALFSGDGTILGKGHNRRIQDGDPSMHAETNAFKNAGRQKSYRKTIMATSLSPCWFCCGLVRQFKIGKIIVGESRNFKGGTDWLEENGVEVIDLDSMECFNLLSGYIVKNPSVWNEDIGEE